MDSSANPRIKAVAFDIDGTFYTNVRMYLRSLPWGLRNWSLVHAFREARHAIRNIRPVSDFHTLQSELTAQILGIKPEAAHALIQKRIYTDWEDSLSGIKLVPGLKDAIQAFRDKGLPLGVLSDFPVSRKLSILGLDGLFDFVISSESFGYLKPGPESFFALAQGLGVEAECILYVGNSYRYDVIGAHNAGMLTAHFARKIHKNGCANFTFKSYEKLKNWVLKNS